MTHGDEKIEIMKTSKIHPVGVCRATGKQRYLKNAAEVKSREKRRREGSNHQPYRCTSCQAWHIGSVITRRPHSRPYQRCKRVSPHQIHLDVVESTKENS